jgi:hypothetical protein
MKRSSAVLELSLVLAVIVIAIWVVHGLDSDTQTELLANTLSNLSGTIIGALLAFWFAKRQFSMQLNLETQKAEEEKRQRRIDRTLDFHREWGSVEFTQARSETDRIFTKHKANGNLDSFYSDLPEEQKNPIRMVLTFFRRLQLEIEHNRVDDELIKELFGGEFLWFYYKWLKDVIPDGWETKKRVEKLNDWMARELPRDEYERLKNQWL